MTPGSVVRNINPEGFVTTSPKKHIVLRPGEHFVSDERVVISTLLGSCVAACLWDQEHGIVGMNHFLLANRRYARDMRLCLTEAGKYGIHAMELVINGMLKRGARRENLRAKAFGGASVLNLRPRDNFNCVGEVNGRFILEFLKTDGIPLVASDLGGNAGRVIYFSSDDFSVYVRKVGKTGAQRVVRKEKGFWRRSIEQADLNVPEPEIWT
jgi:chemotaxis protein CheD